MARCMKFPPPGYVWNGVSGDAVLQLIKVKREENEKRSKKEKRRRKKEVEEELEEGEIRETKRSVDDQKCKKSMKKVEREYDHRMNGNGECENQLLVESSSLTVELEPPVFDSLYDSCDSTKNVKQCCYCITRTDSEVQEQSDLHSSLQATKVIASTFMFSETLLDHLESQYRELIVDFVPPPIQIGHAEFDDQEWLFERKLSRSSVTESSLSDSCNDDDDLPHGRSPVYPCAQYLLQADIPALPYTALF